jgi:TPR repeat protein
MLEPVHTFTNVADSQQPEASNLRATYKKKKSGWFSSIWPFGRTQKPGSYKLMEDLNPVVIQDKGQPESKADDVGHAALGIKSYAQKKYEEGLDHNLQADHFKMISWQNFVVHQKLAVEALEEAANSGHGLAMRKLADIFHYDWKNLPAAVGYYEKLAKLPPCPNLLAGSAYYELAEICRKGGKGVEKNEAQAVHYYEIAVKEGYGGYAIYHLALLLEKGGTGFEPDLKRAFDLLESIADHHADAKCELARIAKTES